MRRSFRVPLPGGRILDLGARTCVMAIVNVTPDSFADGGLRWDPDVAIRDARQMVADGADVLDVGGESTRPGAAPVSADEEWHRVAPVLEGLRGIGVPVSIDTYRAETARRAIDLGAEIVNDISGLTYEPALADVIAARKAAVVLMHTRGQSSNMYANADYRDTAAEVTQELSARVSFATSAGIGRDRIIVDPGLGFAKRAPQTFEMLARLSELAVLELPILSGPSRKSFLKDAIGDASPAARVWASAAAVAASVIAGAHIVRVHDVRAMVDVVRTADAILKGQRAEGRGQR